MIARYLLVSLLTGLTVSDKFTLPNDYSVEVLPPTEDDTPVELLASVNLRNILDVMETKQQIREGRGHHCIVIVCFPCSLEITLRYYWRDPRIVPVAEHLNEEDGYGGYVNLHPGTADMSSLFMFSADIYQTRQRRSGCLTPS